MGTTFVWSSRSIGHGVKFWQACLAGHRSDDVAWAALRFFSPVMPSEERDKGCLGGTCPTYGTAAGLCHCSPVLLLTCPSRLQRGIKLRAFAQETSFTDHEQYFPNKLRDLSPLITVSIPPQIALHLLSLCEHSWGSSRLCCVRTSAFCAFPCLADFGKSLPNPCRREV